MLCQSCSQRPASVRIHQMINGRPRQLHLCNTCAEERLFSKQRNPFSMFDALSSFFQDNLNAVPPMSGEIGEEPQPRLERVNIADFFSEAANKVISEAASAAQKWKAQHIDTEHLLLGLIEVPISKSILERIDVDTSDLKQYLQSNLIEGAKEREDIDLSPRAKRVIELAFHESRELGHKYVGPEHILLAILLEGEGMAAQVLAKYALTHTKVRGAVIAELGQEKDKKKSDTPILDEYSADLTAMARENKLDPVVGRADEVSRVIHILSRRRKNNPVLIGEPGVGKTAIAEGLAQRIAVNAIPENLKDKRVIALDLGSLVAGTKHRGEFEDRLKKIMKEIEAAKSSIILFIDELHTIIGAGSAEGSIDASNMLKPALARGELQAIGATTIDEYRKHVEKDAALERRFQPVMIGEPSVEDTIEILRGLRDKYEAHHKVEIRDDAIIAAATLSDRYISDRFLPDKAIDLIDEAAAKVRLASLNTPEQIKAIEIKVREATKELDAAKRAGTKDRVKELTKKLQVIEDEKKTLDEQWKRTKATGASLVTAKEVESIVAQWTGIPVSQLDESEIERLLKLEEKLKERVIGQEEAIAKIAEAVRRGRAGLKNPNRPVGSFLFLGPTGVGKTELTKALAEVLFGDEEAMIRIDMSEYMEKHAVAKLVGSPPGYVGYDEGGQLTEKIRRKPYSVVLFDEIEKAHPDFFNLLLQVLEDGRLTDSHGRTVDFKNTIIIATSNIGSRMIQESSESRFGFEDGDDGDAKRAAARDVTSKKNFDELKSRLMSELKEVFRPEFLNRIDEIVVFHALDKKQMVQIVDIIMSDLTHLLRGQGVELIISAKAKEKLVDIGYEPTFGARPLRRTMQRELENPLSTKLLAGEIKEHDRVSIDVAKDGSFTFAVEKALSGQRNKSMKKKVGVAKAS